MERLTNEPDSATFSPGVDRALEILELLGNEPLTLSELSARLGFPKNAVFRITNTLKARGYLARDEKTLKFRLTDKLLRVSQPRVERKGLIEVSMDAMRALRDECRETVQIGRRFGDEGVILEQVEGLHPLRISVDPGLRFPLYNNAPGKLLLAFMPDAQRAATIRRLTLTPCTPRTITDPLELAAEIADVRERGYASAVGEREPDLTAVAAPIRGSRGELEAIVALQGPSARFDEQAREQALPVLVSHAEAISRELGWSPG